MQRQTESVLKCLGCGHTWPFHYFWESDHRDGIFTGEIHSLQCPLWLFLFRTIVHSALPPVASHCSDDSLSSSLCRFLISVQLLVLKQHYQSEADSGRHCGCLILLISNMHKSVIVVQSSVKEFQLVLQLFPTNKQKISLKSHL